MGLNISYSNLHEYVTICYPWLLWPHYSGFWGKGEIKGDDISVFASFIYTP